MVPFPLGLPAITDSAVRFDTVAVLLFVIDSTEPVPVEVEIDVPTAGPMLPVTEYAPLALV